MKGSRKRILVTGGAGFLGSHLIDRLLADGHHVLCLDNLFTGSLDNLARHRPNPNFEFMQRDVCEPLRVEVEEIYNLACPASPIHYQSDPVQTTRTSVLGALNVLELARRLDCKVLQASTSEVYGDPKVHPQAEDYWGNVNPIGPRSCYDEAKRCAETLFFDYRRQHGVQIKVARIFNTYGPRMQIGDGRVVSNLVTQALSGRPITLYGGGGQTRAFCYVTDLVEGFLKLMASPSDVTGPINLGNPEEISVADLARLIVEMTGSTSSLESRPLPQDDPVQRCPDISLARAALGWAPKVALRHGLAETIDHFRAILGAGASLDVAAPPGRRIRSAAGALRSDCLYDG